MESIPRTSGVYKIVCVPTGKVYVGSAIDLHRRFVWHWWALRRGRHGNEYLQRAWAKYGESAFRFEVIELVLSAFVLDREQYWIDKVRAAVRTKGFNLHPSAAGAAGYKRPAVQCETIRARMLKRMADPAARAAVSEVHKGKTLSPEHIQSIKRHLTGKKRPETVVQPMRAAWLKARGRSYIITSPTGDVYHSSNLTAFCRDHDLRRANLKNILCGHQQQHRGWTCRYAD